MIQINYNFKRLKVKNGERNDILIYMTKNPIFDQEILENGKAKWAQHKNICRDITTELKNYPCSYIFEQPIECKVPDKVKYLSLPIILTNIENDTYTELKDWLFDMKLLLMTKSKINQRDGEFAVCYDFVQRLLKKTKRFNLTSFKGWSKTIKSYKLKIDSLLQTAPPAARPYFPSDIPQIDYTTTNIGRSQIEFILKNYQKIQNPNDMHSLLNIIRLDINGSEPKDGFLNVDLFSLSVPTKCKIYDFLKSRIKDDDEDHSLKI